MGEQPASDPGAHPARTQLADLVTRAARPGGPRLGGPHAFDAEQAAGFRPAAVLLGFTPAHRSTGPAVDLFLVQRSPLLRVHPGQIALPGGRIESTDSSATAAALREAHEEIGMSPQQVEVLGTLPQVLVPVSSFVVTPVVGWIPDSRTSGHTDIGEVLHTLRLPVADLVRPERRRTVALSGVRAPGSAGFEVTGGWVWGFTGNLLDHVFTELGWAKQWDSARQYLMPVTEALGGHLRPAQPDVRSVPDVRSDASSG